ncbi:LAQU0S09e01244g1_1 [Lachancea quebecensis]|uniref:LAQU0S09e01244g1_1 n=1 Tax=Lachancea quebecensis TaxID=1654605 RepID=A0A0P1KTV5_9SACH|nr:LAQU0S09e01244g1_1 [Lachancea quebecensis]
MPCFILINTTRMCWYFARELPAVKPLEMSKASDSSNLSQRKLDEDPEANAPESVGTKRSRSQEVDDAEEPVKRLKSDDTEESKERNEKVNEAVLQESKGEESKADHVSNEKGSDNVPERNNKEAKSDEGYKQLSSEKGKAPELTKEGETSKDKKVSQEAAKEGEDDATKESQNASLKPSAKPKFAFGASSGFSAGFGLAKSPTPISNTPESISSPKEGSSESKASTKPAAFGSGFAFGAGFCALNKDKNSGSRVFASEAEKAKSASPVPDNAKADDAKEISSGTDAEGVVKLQKQDVKSGEESEESIFQVNAKLYQLTNLKEGWKERGVGALHVNKDPHNGKARIVMRSRGILKVILNVLLVKGVVVHKGFPASLQGEKFIRIVTVDHDKTPLQYAVRMGKAEAADELYETIQKLIP